MTERIVILKIGAYQVPAMVVDETTITDNTVAGRARGKQIYLSPKTRHLIKVKYVAKEWKDFDHGYTDQVIEKILDSSLVIREADEDERAECLRKLALYAMTGGDW